jgi:hypothetical protein
MVLQYTFPIGEWNNYRTEKTFDEYHTFHVWAYLHCPKELSVVVRNWKRRRSTRGYSMLCLGLSVPIDGKHWGNTGPENRAMPYFWIFRNLPSPTLAALKWSLL